MPRAPLPRIHINAIEVIKADPGASFDIVGLLWSDSRSNRTIQIEKPKSAKQQKPCLVRLSNAGAGIVNI